MKKEKNNDMDKRITRIEKEIELLDKEFSDIFERSMNTKKNWMIAGVVILTLVGVFFFGWGLYTYAVVDEKAYCEKMINASYPDMDFTVYIGPLVEGDSYTCSADVKKVLYSSDKIQVSEKESSSINFKFFDPEGVEYLLSDDSWGNIMLPLIGLLFILVAYAITKEIW